MREHGTLPGLCLPDSCTVVSPGFRPGRKGGTPGRSEQRKVLAALPAGSDGPSNTGWHPAAVTEPLDDTSTRMRAPIRITYLFLLFHCGHRITS